jgi:hypothetical protein
MADTGNAEDAVFRIFIKADIHRVWREFTEQGEAQGAVFNAWLHSVGAHEERGQALEDPLNHRR